MRCRVISVEHLLGEDIMNNRWKTILTDADLYHAYLFQIPVAVLKFGDLIAVGFVHDYTDELVRIEDLFYLREQYQFRIRENVQLV
jgi:hypothetical protein